MFGGAIASLDGERLALGGEPARALSVREVQSIWIAGRPGESLDDIVPPPPPEGARPAYRLRRSALGERLAIGRRTFSRGIGLRGPSSLEVPVPSGARWLLLGLGADAGAAPLARVGIEVLVHGQSCLRREGLVPGAEVEEAAVSLAGAGSIAIRVFPSSSEDPTGCLGDIVDALFVR